MHTNLQVPSPSGARPSPAHQPGCPRGLEQALPLTEASGTSPSITQRGEPQILRSLSASVMLKGKLTVAAIHSHSSLLRAAMAQVLLSDKSVVCSAASADQGWGQGRGQGLWSWKNLQPSSPWRNSTEDTTGKSHPECQPREGAARAGSISTTPSDPTSSVLDGQVALLSSPDPYP